MSKSPFVKVKTVFQEEGARGVFWKLVRKVGNLIYKKQTFVFLNRDLSLTVRAYRKLKRWQDRQFKREDIVFCKKHFERFMPHYHDLFDLGLKAFASFETETNDVIGIAWYADKDFYDQHYLHHNFNVSNHQVLQFACEVSEPYRNTQISGSGLKYIYEYWKEKGKTELITTIDASNSPSLRLMFHLGWEETGEALTFHRLFGYRWQSTEYYQGERFGNYKKRKHIK